jgi:predicted dienelactone hydrolase
MLCEVSDAPLQTLSSASAGVVHEFSDIDEMPISQGFLEFIVERARRTRSRARTRTATAPRRVVATCRDAAGVGGYTFR